MRRYSAYPKGYGGEIEFLEDDIGDWVTHEEAQAEVELWKRRFEAVRECLLEAIDLMEDVKEGTYKPDSLTTQPWKKVVSND
jgi:hypothetical protein